MIATLQYACMTEGGVPRSYMRQIFEAELLDSTLANLGSASALPERQAILSSVAAVKSMPPAMRTADVAI